METTTISIGAIAVLCCGIGCAVWYWKPFARFTNDVVRKREGITLRDSAAFALSCYWSHYYEGWSLVLFRDDSGVVRHVACGRPDGKYFDSSGQHNLAQIAERLGTHVTAADGDEKEVQALLGPNSGVLEAAEELRQREDRNTVH